MTLANMRENGVRSLLVYCTACPRIVVFNVDACESASNADSHEESTKSPPWRMSVIKHRPSGKTG
jgi:hypothetical protein